MAPSVANLIIKIKDWSGKAISPTGKKCIYAGMRKNADIQITLAGSDVESIRCDYFDHGQMRDVYKGNISFG
jgi:hypothetical protein